MYSYESVSDQALSYQALGTGSGYELTEEEKTLLEPGVKYALAVASEAMRRSFTDAKDMTQTMTDLTHLNRETLIEFNKKFRHDGLVELHVDAHNPCEMQFLLTQKGEQFLAEQLS